MNKQQHRPHSTSTQNDEAEGGTDHHWLWAVNVTEKIAATRPVFC